MRYSEITSSSHSNSFDSTFNSSKPVLYTCVTLTPSSAEFFIISAAKGVPKLLVSYEGDEEGKGKK